MTTAVWAADDERTGGESLGEREGSGQSRERVEGRGYVAVVRDREENERLLSLASVHEWRTSEASKRREGMVLMCRS